MENSRRVLKQTRLETDEPKETPGTNPWVAASSFRCTYSLKVHNSEKCLSRIAFGNSLEKHR